MAKSYKRKSGWNFWSVMGVIFLVLIIAGGAVALTGYFLGWYDKTEESSVVVDTDVEGVDPNFGVDYPGEETENDSNVDTGD